MRRWHELMSIPVTLVMLMAYWLAGANSADAATVFFSTGNPNGLMATASRPASAGKIEIETGDDFILSATTAITSASFTGLLPSGLPLSDVNQVVVEIYRVFPRDSATPTSGNVPTRVNSPSDVAFDSRDNTGATLSFTANLINPSFTSLNSVLNGINPLPNQTTLGEGPVTGQEVQFSINFATPFVLPADHYFFVPQVGLNNPGDFFWLSAPKPIVPPGTPFAPDLQSWIRDQNLDPDWLRVGTDIVGQGQAFNATFSLTGETVPEPGTMLLLGVGFAGLVLAGWRRRAG